jgi:hypothetical protein
LQKITTVTSNHLLASAYSIAQYKNHHSIEESLVLLVTAVIVETMPGESNVKELRKNPLAENTMGRKLKTFLIN